MEAIPDNTENHAHANVFHIRCSIRYTGRIDAELELGDRILLIMGDGAAVVHAAHGGVQAKNWMPTGTVWKNLGDIGVPWVGEHVARGEKLEIYVEEIWGQLPCLATLNGKLIKLGSEREMSDLLAQNIELVEKDLVVVAREHPTPVGPIDILAARRDGTPVIIEVKRARVTGVEVAYQLQRYKNALHIMPEWQGYDIHGYLVAPGLGRMIRAELERLSFDFRGLDYDGLLQASQQL